MMAALKKVLDGCKRHKVQPGIHCGAPAYAKQMIEMGFTLSRSGGQPLFDDGRPGGGPRDPFRHGCPCRQIQ